VSSRTCPDWPALMERAPDLQFMHYTLAEAQLPAEVVVTIADVSRETVAICCDLDRHVFNADHTDPQVAAALRDSHWYDLREWTASGPGGGA
jgi:hypothetical protein